MSPVEQYGSHTFGSCILALLEVVEHNLGKGFEHIFQILIGIDAGVSGQVVVGVRSAAGIQAIAKREGVRVADGIIWVFVTCLRCGGAVMGGRSRITNSILGNDRIIRLLR